MSAVLNIGWVGVGTMGLPMCENLLKAGFPLSVYNRTREKTKPLADKGVRIAEIPFALWKTSDVIALMLTNDNACEEVISGKNGLLSGNVDAGKVIVNSSTISPDMAQKLAAAAAAKKIVYIDAPVAGSAWAAADASLLFLAGGDKKEIDRLAPFFSALGKKTYYVGPVSSGNKAKLAINYLIAINYLGLAETVLFAGQLGIDKATMLDIINNSGAGNVTTRAKTQPIVENKFEPIAFTLGNMLKDIKLAKAAGNHFPLLKSMLPTYLNASEAGYGNKDVMEIIRYLAKDYKG